MVIEKSRAGSTVAGTLLFGAMTGMLASGCSAPKLLEVSGRPDEAVVIDWQDTSAMGLYVTATDADIPSGPGQKVKGLAYWVLEATSFPSGFEHPVTYGTVPEDAKDATAEHGGAEGPAPLSCGVEYKVAVVSLGGSAEVLVTWDCKG